MLDILELIPSKDVREHIKKTGRVFTDFEKAAIIYNLKLPILERNEHLQKIADTTEDTVLRAQILERIESDQDAIRRFQEDSNGFIYRLDPSVYATFFTDASLAYETGMQLRGDSFQIVKCPVAHESVSEVRSQDIATMKYQDGSLIELGEYDSYEDCCDPSRFEHAYVDIPSPFEAGDIVQAIRAYHGHGVVISPQEQREQTDADQQHKLFSDTTIPVDFLNSYGMLSLKHLCPLFLERYEPDTDDADWLLLYEGSRLRAGAGSLDRFIQGYEIYRANRMKQLEARLK